MRSRKFIHAAVAVVAATTAAAQLAQAAPLTPGNLLLTRAVGGSGTYNTGTGSMTTPTVLTGGGVTATVVLDEYTAAGVFVQSIQMPNTNVPIGSPAGNRGLVLSGTQNNEGTITLSQNGQYFVVGGYNQTAGIGPSNGALSTAVERVVGLVDLNGNINTTTALQDVGSGQPIRSAYSTNGTDIWVGGTSGGTVTINAVPGIITAGVHYATVGSTTSTQLTAGNTNQRILNGFNGQLYLSSNSTGAAARGVSTVGAGFPTGGGPALPITQLPGFNAVTAPTPSNETANDYWFMDATTLYIADLRNGATGSGNGDGVNGGVQKWLFVDTNADLSPDSWVFQYNVPLGTQAGNTVGGNVGAAGLAGTIDPLSGQAVLFATTFDGAGANRTRLFRLQDPGTQVGFAASLALLATSPDQVGGFPTAFRGVEIIPVPEPACLAALSVVGLLALRRQRRPRA